MAMTKTPASTSTILKTTEGQILKSMTTSNARKYQEGPAMTPTASVPTTKSSSCTILVVTKANFAKNITLLEKTLKILMMRPLSSLYVLMGKFAHLHIMKNKFRSN